MNRREFIGAAAGALTLATSPKISASANPDVTKFVNPIIGTGGHGHTYPGATVPFGMVQLSPDTYNDDWDWCSGYHYSDTSIMGFSHTHLSGTGVGDMLDFLLMPSTRQIRYEPGSRENPDQGYRSRFSHSEETAEAGYYSVVLADYKIRAELTASERVGFHRYTLPESTQSHFILDLAHVYGKDTKIDWAQLQAIGNDTLLGGRSTAGWANGREMYFAMKFSRPFVKIELMSDGVLATGSKVTSPNVKAAIQFPTLSGEVILVKTALSGVSVAGALENLKAEIPDWDFEAVRSAARESWRRELGKIQIEGGDEAKQQIFYTSLYHTFVAPTLFDDVDGAYKGMDGKIHHLPPGSHNYSTFSLWDTYRAAHPLFTLVQPERVVDFCNCLIRMAYESPAGVPVWPLQAKETGCMTGFHSLVVLAEAAEKGFEGIDLKAAYPAIRRRLMADDYRGMKFYRQYGYLPCDLADESVSKSLGYAYDDYAGARIAKAIGQSDDAILLKKRSTSYRLLFDSSTCFVRPKLKSGQFLEPFNPKEIQISKQWKDFTESNSWQETFANQHDVRAYIEMFGGRAAFLAKLDGLFNQSSELPADMPPDVDGLVGMYAQGNEPSHHVAYLYCYSGAPWKAQSRIRSLLETMYHAEPNGMAGNEDCGQMSAWYVLSAIGFYAVDPVSGNYVIGTPLFDRVTMTVTQGKTLEITSRRPVASAAFVESLEIHGKPSTKLWFHHADIRNGGSIHFDISAEPNKELGSHEADAPPSFV